MSFDLTSDPRRARALELLLAGKTQAATARELGVERQQINRWVQRDDAFRFELQTRQAERLSAVQAGMLAVGLRAVEELRKMLEDPDTPPTARVKAIQIALDRVAPKRSEIGVDMTTRPAEPAEPDPRPSPATEKEISDALDAALDGLAVDRLLAEKLLDVVEGEP